MTAMGPVSGQAITLANSIIGVGILAMPFCFKQCGIILSILILITSSYMSRLACHFLLKSSILSRRRNFESLAFHVFGSTGKFAVEIGIIGFLMGTCIAYFVVVGDLGPQIIAKMLNLNQSDMLRTSVMVVVSLVCVLPLGLLRNVDSLSNVCMATIAFYFCLVVKVILEAGNQMASGEWMRKVEYWQPDGVLQCLPIFSMALFCQTQLFEIYDTVPGVTLDKMNAVIKNAVNICTSVYILVGLFGYIAFSNQPFSGNVLTSFSPSAASDAIKMGFVLSLAFSFPLIIFPCRASLYSLLFRKGQGSPHELLNNLIPEKRFRFLTVFIIAISLLIGLMLPNIELVLGFVGSTIGVMICVIFPATCFICVTTKNTNERILAQIVLCFGIIIMVLGTYANLQAAEMDNIKLQNKLAATAELEHKLFMDKKAMEVLASSKDPEIINLNPEKLTDKKPPENIPELIKNIIDVKAVVTKDKELLDSRVEPPNPVAPKEDTLKSSVDTKNVESVTQANKVEIVPETVVKDDKEGAGDEEVKHEVKVPEKEVIQEVPTDKPVKKNDILENEKKLETLKKAAFIETIKQHEEAQREMVVEQKKILEEMKENIPAKVDKKVIRENIEKLAKIAIESLGADLDPIVKELDGNPKNDGNANKNDGDFNKNDGNSKNDGNANKNDGNFNKNDGNSNKNDGNSNNEVNHQVDPKNGSESKVILDVDLPVLPKNVEIEKKVDLKIPDLSANIPKETHVHRNDEPESYKAGEELNQMKPHNEVKLSPEIKADILQGRPIAITLAKIGETQNKKFENEVVKESPVLQKNDYKVKQNVAEWKTESNRDYVAGKRDILEVHTEKREEFHRNSLHNDRHKRSIIDTTKIVKNEGAKLCQGAEIHALSQRK